VDQPLVRAVVLSAGGELSELGVTGSHLVIYHQIFA
jgi:hypothetical protein